MSQQQYLHNYHKIFERHTKIPTEMQNMQFSQRIIYILPFFCSRTRTNTYIYNFSHNNTSSINYFKLFLLSQLSSIRHTKIQNTTNV